MEEINPEYVNTLTQATENFLCPLSANTFGIEFLYFRIRDLDSGTVLVEVAKDEDEEEKNTATSESETPAEVSPEEESL
jgi:hypothetical protein